MDSNKLLLSMNIIPKFLLIIIFTCLSVNLGSLGLSEVERAKPVRSCDPRVGRFDSCQTDRVSIKIKNNLHLSKVDEIAFLHNFTNLGQVGNLENVFTLVHNDGPRDRDSFKLLLDHPHLDWVQIQYPKQRRRFKPEKCPSCNENNVDLEEDSKNTSHGHRHERRPIVNHEGRCYWPDPWYCDKKQWHLLDAEKHEDGGYMRVEQAWKLGFSGKGVVVTILDDGIQANHPDLAENFDTKASTDINGNDTDPSPRHNGYNEHGTRCAGEVAAVAGNDRCGVGVAYNARIGGVRMLDGNVTDEVEARSLSFNPSYIDIYSASWGPSDDGDVVDGPGPLTQIAFEEGIRKGRGGKGNVYVWASGDGGKYGDSCSCDGYLTSIYTISISSTTNKHRPPEYLEECPSTMTTTYSSNDKYRYGIVTTDIFGCTDEHTGTSASAPLAAGVIALALEANGNLTWRDVQHLVVRSSNPAPLISNSGWTENGVKRKYSHKFGFGLIDAEAIVKLAKNWHIVPPQLNCTFRYRIEREIHLGKKEVKSFKINVPSCSSGQGPGVRYVEHVQAVISADSTKRGSLKFTLISPMNTSSYLLNPRRRDTDKLQGYQDWPFLSVQHWGENPQGTWTLLAENTEKDQKAYLTKFSLIIYGTHEPPHNDQDHNRTTNHIEVPVESVISKPPALFKVCHEECDAEQGCHTAESADGCVRCSNFAQEIFVNSTASLITRCLKQCPMGYYAENVTQTSPALCVLCEPDCAVCSAKNSCQQCQTNFFLLPESTSCVKSCPDGYVESLKYGVCRKLGITSFYFPNVRVNSYNKVFWVVTAAVFCGVLIGFVVFMYLTYKDKRQEKWRQYTVYPKIPNFDLLQHKAMGHSDSLDNLYEADVSDDDENNPILRNFNENVHNHRTNQA